MFSHEIALRSQSAVEASRTRSLSEGGSGGLTGPLNRHTRSSGSQPRKRGRPKTCTGENPSASHGPHTANNTRFDGGLREEEIKRPTLKKSGPYASTIRTMTGTNGVGRPTYYLQRCTRGDRESCFPDRIHRTIDPIVESMADWVCNKPEPAKRVIIDSRTSSGVRVDQRSAVQNVVDTGRRRVFLGIDTCALLVRRATACSDHRQHHDADNIPRDIHSSTSLGSVPILAHKLGSLHKPIKSVADILSSVQSFDFWGENPIPVEKKEIPSGAWWAIQVSNLWPLPCEGSALPLS